MQSIRLGRTVSLSETKSTIEEVKRMLAKNPTPEVITEAHNILDSLLDDLSYTGGNL